MSNRRRRLAALGILKVFNSIKKLNKNNNDIERILIHGICKCLNMFSFPRKGHLLKYLLNNNNVDKR